MRGQKYDITGLIATNAVRTQIEIGQRQLKVTFTYKLEKGLVDQIRHDIEQELSETDEQHAQRIAQQEADEELANLLDAIEAEEAEQGEEAQENEEKGATDESVDMRVENDQPAAARGEGD